MIAKDNNPENKGKKSTFKKESLKSLYTGVINQEVKKGPDKRSFLEKIKQPNLKQGNFKTSNRGRIVQNPKNETGDKTKQEKKNINRVAAQASIINVNSGEESDS